MQSNHSLNEHSEENAKIPSYEIKMLFDAKERDAQALYEALSLITDSWNRHKRITNASCLIELKENS